MGVVLSIENQAELLAYLESKTKQMLATAKAKNSDYTNGSDPFGNFVRVELLGICKTEVGFLTRMTDKLCRISSFVSSGTLAVKDESVQDTLLDLANYALLLSAYIESKKANKLQPGKDPDAICLGCCYPNFACRCPRG